MTTSIFNHVKIVGFNTVVPEKVINIDDEIEFFDYSEKKLNRAKKMVGYGTRHVVDENTTVVDLCVDAATKLFKSLNYNSNEIDLLIFVNQKPDYRDPTDACLAHGRLGLSKNCATLNLNLGCSGYVYGLWTAMGLLCANAAKKCLLLAGDISSFNILRENRKLAGLFGDAGTATILEYNDNFELYSYFDVGSNGLGWNKIITPFGGARLPFTAENINLKAIDSSGNIWSSLQPIIDGGEVFNFSTEIAPSSINNVLSLSGKSLQDIDFYAIHQANKQIVKTIADKLAIPKEKFTYETFSKYGNTSTASVLTVLCDVLFNKKPNNIILCSFGVGLSWASCLINISDTYNGGISIYVPLKDIKTKQEQTEYWVNYVKGE